MEKTYICNKNILLEEVKKIEFRFNNGDILALRNTELIENSIKLCDAMQRVGDGYDFFGKEVYLKFKIKKSRVSFSSEHLVDKELYKKDRKAYIENRCAQNQDLRSVHFFNLLNWSYGVYSNYTAQLQGDFLIIKGEYMGKCESENGSIRLRDIKKDDICRIELGFENCDHLEIFCTEILEFDLDYDETLSWDGNKLYRAVKSGCMKLKLIEKNRKASIYISNNPTIKKIEQRICEKNGICEHDICRLNIILPHYLGDESIEVYDSRFCAETDDEDFDDDDEPTIDFIGGYAKKLKDGSICIAFGKDAEKTIN